MRRWERAFRRGSFRGVLFWVEKDGPQVGRRVAVHEVSGGESAITEDMGRLTVEYRVTAYVASDLADIEGIALEIACQVPGPSILILPMDPPSRVHCLRCSRDRSRDHNGYVGYDLVFVEAGSEAASPTSGLPAVRQVFTGGIGRAAAGLAGAFW